MTSQIIERGPPDSLPAQAADFAILTPLPVPWRRPWHSVVWLLRLLWGVVSLVALWTLLAAVPFGNIFVLGYLIHCQEEVARTGKLRRALPGLPAAGRLAWVATAIGVCLSPVWWLACATKNAWLIDPQNPAAWYLCAALLATSLLSGAHILLAVARGGSVGCFLRPIKNVRWLRMQLKSGAYWARADEALREFFAALRPVHCLRLGVCGFVGTCAWLAVPIVVYSACRGGNSSWQRGLVIVASIWLVGALAWLPFLQVRMALENRLGALFEWREVRELFRHSPWAWLSATCTLYAASIPLFIYSAHLRLHAPIHDVWWDLALVSMVCTFPARVLVGWAYHRAVVRKPSWSAWVWLCRLILLGMLVC